MPYPPASTSRSGRHSSGRQVESRRRVAIERASLQVIQGNHQVVWRRASTARTESGVGVRRAAFLSQTSSSVVSQPMPWTEAAFDLPLVDRRVQRLAAIMQDVDARAT